MLKKAITGIVTVAAYAFMVGGVAIMPAQGQTQQDCVAVSAALVALGMTQTQVDSVLAALNCGGDAPVAPSFTFTRDLSVGSVGPDVMALQQFLNANGFTVAVSGAGSVGMESTYFGGLTQAALARYQAANGIAPAAGYFGPITRAQVNSTTPVTPPVTPPTDPNVGASTYEDVVDRAELAFAGRDYRVDTITYYTDGTFTTLTGSETPNPLGIVPSAFAEITFDVDSEQIRRGDREDAELVLTFRVRYAVTATAGTDNGKYFEVRIESVEGQTVPTNRQTSPTATINL